jgi:N-methylhydantoinase A
MRYVGQEHAVTVELPQDYFAAQDREAIKRAFDDVHLQRYGTCAPKEPAELVSLRSTVVGLMRKPPVFSQELAHDASAEAALDRRKPVYFKGHGFVDTPVYARMRLQAGMTIAGPALVEEHASTSVLAPGDTLNVDRFGNLDIAIGGGRS